MIVRPSVRPQISILLFVPVGNVAQKGSFAKSVILYLVKKGADVNVRDKYGLSPLHYAAMRGNEEATKELLSCSGIDLEVIQSWKKGRGGLSTWKYQFSYDY